MKRERGGRGKENRPKKVKKSKINILKGHKWGKKGSKSGKEGLKMERKNKKDPQKIPKMDKSAKKPQKSPKCVGLPRVTSDCMGMESAGCLTSQLNRASLSIWGFRVHVRVARASTVPSLTGACVCRK